MGVGGWPGGAKLGIFGFTRIFLRDRGRPGETTLGIFGFPPASGISSGGRLDFAKAPGAQPAAFVIAPADDRGAGSSLPAPSWGPGEAWGPRRVGGRALGRPLMPNTMPN